MAPPPATNPIPPVLPPSVEEAYRRKCIQLRSRTQTVSDANDAARIRLLRMRRGIEKMRLERAFLLEQVARRVKPNDDSSDGSPSPPPTPKQKPLRVKRGRRGPDFLAHEMSNSHTNQISHEDTQGDTQERSRPDYQARNSNPYDDLENGIDIARIGRNLKPQNGFEVFAQDLFGPLSVNNRREIAKGEYDVRAEIVKKWRDAGPQEQERWNRRFRNGDFASPDRNGQSFARTTDGGTEDDGQDGRSPENADVEMGDGDERD